MKEETEKTENLFSPEVWEQFKRVKTEFSRVIAPKVRERAHFSPNSVKKARKQKRSRKHNGLNCFVKLPPLAASLNQTSLNEDFSALQRAAQAVARDYFPAGSATDSTPIAVVENGKIVSVFVVLEFQIGPVVKYHLQKIEKKTRPGFPGGGIKDGESILEAGTRELKEETNPNPAEGIDISKYNPIEIGTFPLRGALNGERGVILLVKVPETEIARIRPGGGEKEEGEVVSNVYLATAEQINHLVEEEEILFNSATIWQILKKIRN